MQVGVDEPDRERLPHDLPRRTDRDAAQIGMARDERGQRQRPFDQQGRQPQLAERAPASGRGTDRCDDRNARIAQACQRQQFAHGACTGRKGVRQRAPQQPPAPVGPDDDGATFDVEQAHSGPPPLRIRERSPRVEPGLGVDVRALRRHEEFDPRAPDLDEPVRPLHAGTIAGGAFRSTTQSARANVRRMPTPTATLEPLPEGAHVLVVRLSALGDVLFALEAVAALRAERPDVRIDFLVEDRFAGVLADHPDLTAVRTLPRKGLSARLRGLWALRCGPRYDAVLDVHGLLKSALPARLVRTRRRIGFAPPLAKEGAHRFYTETVTAPRPTPHRAEQGLHLLRALGLRGAPCPASLALAEPPPELRAHDGPLVVLHPGTSAFAAFKRWPIERFAVLAERLTAAGFRVAVSFGPGERAMAESIRTAAPACLPLDGGALGLLRLAAAYRAADVVVAADTGPLHIAAAAGARVLALFGPKDTNLYGPRDHGAGHRILFHDVPCRPCRRRRCASPQCILGLDVDRVEAEVLAMLGERA